MLQMSGQVRKENSPISPGHGKDCLCELSSSDSQDDTQRILVCFEHPFWDGFQKGCRVSLLFQDTCLRPVPAEPRQEGSLVLAAGVALDCLKPAKRVRGL